MNNEVHIPTITGTQVITLPSAEGGILKSYKAKINQSGTNDPVAVEVFNTLGGSIQWTRSSAGEYYGELIGAFSGTVLVYVTNGLRAGYLTSIASVSGEKLSSESIQYRTTLFDDTPSDDSEVFISVDVLATDNDDIIFTIYDGLDANQQALFTKIILRKSGVVYEVDGDKYRRTFSFNDSSKIINS